MNQTKMKLCIPENILHQHAVVLGKTGAGKSSKLRHIVEHLLAQKKRVCIIDPKGDWWGLKKSASGKGAGFNEVIAFGDFKEQKASDVPINAQSGKHIADLITSGNRPCIIGFRGWMPGALVKFWLDFAPALFNAQSGELYLVVDEVHNFAPKGKIMSPEAGECIHWTNRLMSEGRGLGLICFIASQRPQKVHNDTLTCCETLIAARMVHKADRDAVKDWIDGCGDSDKGDEVLDGLAQLERPQAWVWSPEAGFGPEIVTFPMFETFDSFAPPQLQKKVSDEGWGTVNLDDVKAKLASVIEERKANDPEVLKAEVRRLNGELKKASTTKAPSAPSKPVEVIKEVPVLTDEERKRLSGLLDKIEDLKQDVVTELGSLAGRMEGLHGETQFFKRILETKFTALPQRGRVINQVVDVNRPSANRRSVPASSRTLASAESSNGNLGKSERAILIAAIQRHPKHSSRAQLAILSGYSLTSSGFANALGALRSGGFLLGGGDDNYPSEAGIELLPDVPPMPTGQDLVNHWLGRLDKAERTMLEAIAGNPDGLEKEQLAELSGYSITSSGFANAIGKLRTLELICRGYPIKPTAELFE